MDQGKWASRWPFNVASTATKPGPGAVSEDAGQSWLIIDGEGRYLRCWFGGEPDWCHLRGNARRYSATEAAAQLCRLSGLGTKAAQVAA